MAWIVKSSPCPEWDTCPHAENCIYGHVYRVHAQVDIRSVAGMITVFVVNMALAVDFLKVVILRLDD